MKIKSLKIRHAYGYLNLNIKFKSDLTFLIGINGSGKTTALKIIEALLTPSLSLLDKIPHDSAELTLLNSRQSIKIISSVSDNQTSISVPSIEGENTLNYAHPESNETVSRSASEVPRDPYGILMTQLASHPVIRFLRDELDTPLFMGIDRRNIAVNFDSFDDRLISPLARQRAMHINSVRRRMPISGQLGSSLVDVQLMIQEIYKKTAEEQIKFSSQLQESIFLDAFDYQPGSGFLKALRQNEQPSKFLESIIKKRNGVESALKNSGLAEQKYRPVVSKFFTHIEALARKASMPGKEKTIEIGDVAIELAYNKPVVDRVLKLIDSSEIYNKSINQIWGPINDFLSLVNQFLSDSHKELVIDQVGWLYVKVEGNELRSLDVLSSGERQIVVIFGHLAINRELNRAGIFVIDEPELSLHLRWQQIFVDSLLTVSPKNQFILATHSPAIVMTKSDHCSPMEETRGIRAK